MRMKKPWDVSYPLSAQRRLRSDWVDAQADLSSLGRQAKLLDLSCGGSDIVCRHGEFLGVKEFWGILWPFLWLNKLKGQCHD